MTLIIMTDASSQVKNNVGILVDGGPAPGINGVIGAITLETRTRAHKVFGIYDGFQWVIEADTKDPTTGKTRVRRVDIDTPSYKVAREYMIRLEKEDFRDDEKLRQLAQAASSAQNFCTAEQFRDRYHYLTTDLRGVR